MRYYKTTSSLSSSSSPSSWWRCRIAWTAIILCLISSCSSRTTVHARATTGGAKRKDDDLYHILGVAKTATVQEIKRAYRKKALDTHPDKNMGRQEESVIEFQKVVHAFEVLSDDGLRKRYDRFGRASKRASQGRKRRTHNNNNNNHGNGGSSSWNGGHTNDEPQKPTVVKSQSGIKEAQSRILNIVSLEQLKTIMVEEGTNTLERNLLIVFYTPQLEANVLQNIAYPYPFAGNSEQGIWWESLLQTTAVRFHKTNALCQFFDIPNGADMKKPIFIFGKRGQAFSNSTDTKWSRLETNSRAAFSAWVWDQIQVNVKFVNQHDHPVELHWIHGNQAKQMLTLAPGRHSTQTTRLTHEWWVRDARTDTHSRSPPRWKLNGDTMIKTWKITSDEDGQVLVIPLRRCIDISGYCGMWNCRSNRKFMMEQCPKTCGICTEREESPQEEDHTRNRTMPVGDDEL